MELCNCGVVMLGSCLFVYVCICVVVKLWLRVIMPL